jgi:ketosteroid isomerase-like protein
MRLRRLLAIGAVILMTIGLWAQGDTKKPEAKPGSEKKTANSGGVEQTLMDMENKWVEAGKKQDPKVLEPILADGFMSLSPDGTYTNRANYLAGISKAKWEIDEISNMKVHVTGNHAIVTGDWRGKGMDGSGKSVDTTEHWIDAFAKMPNGKWQCTLDASATARK